MSREIEMLRQVADNVSSRDEMSVAYYTLQALVSIAEQLQKIADSLQRIDQTMHEVHLENQQS